MAAKRASEPQRTLRCAVYTRKSTAAGLEKDFNSLDAQREACEAYIRSRALEGWVVLEEGFSDGGFTGANTDRPGFKKLMDHVAHGRVDVVVVYKVDRLSRSLVDFAQVMERFTHHRVAFVSVTQHFSTADPVGRLTLNMLMSFAEFEREMITERIRDKVAAARRKGKWTGGHAPLGYESKGGRLLVLESEVEWVRSIFRRYLEGLGTPRIAKKLNDEAVPMKTSRTGRDRPWTTILVMRILRNRLYLGEIACQGEFVTAEHPALVDAATFERVQRMLEPTFQRIRHTSKNPAYLLRGTLRCGHCGGVMTSASTHRNGRLYRYYRCSTRIKRGKEVCPTKQFPTETIESFVVERVRTALSLPEVGIRVSRLLPEWFGALPLRGFDALWGVLTLRHRQSLIRLLVAEVVVEEAKGTLRIRMRGVGELDAQAEALTGELNGALAPTLVEALPETANEVVAC